MFPAKDADEEEDRRDEPGQDDHHNHLDHDEYDDGDNVDGKYDEEMTLCPVRHALYLVANFTEQNLWKEKLWVGFSCLGGK